MAGIGAGPPLDEREGPAPAAPDGSAGPKAPLPVRRMPRPVREFLDTEVASGVVILTAAVVALVWANSPWSAAYESLWETELVLRLGELEVDHDLRDWVNEVRSEIPAVTHVDHSARIQTVRREQSPDYHAILAAFEARTGCPVLINTSFNVRGEPIVCTPVDAYRCFMRTEIDHLVLGRNLLDKRAQPAWAEDRRWQEDFVLD